MVETVVTVHGRDGKDIDATRPTSLTFVTRAFIGAVGKGQVLTWDRLKVDQPLHTALVVDHGGSAW